LRLQEPLLQLRTAEYQALSVDATASRFEWMGAEFVLAGAHNWLLDAFNDKRGR